MNLGTIENCAIDIIVPFYKNSHLVEPLFASLWQVPVRLELSRLRCSLVVVNDSPGDLELQNALRVAIEDTGDWLPIRLFENPENLGFVRSVNRALETTIEAKRDAILLNSDTIVYPGA